MTPLMEPDELRRLWDGAGGGGAGAATAPGCSACRVTDDPAALTGMALAVLGLPLDDAGAGPAEIRRASQRYADWLPALAGGFRAADYGDVEVVDDDPAVAFMQAHERLADIVAAGAAPLVLGGDALVSVPVLQVLTGKLRGRLGVVAFTPAYEIAPEPLYAPASRWARRARARRRLAGQPGARRRAGGSAGRARPPRPRRPRRHDLLARGRPARRHGHHRAGGARDGGFRDRGRVPLRRPRRGRRRRRPGRPAGEGARRRSRRRVERAARGGRRVRPRRRPARRRPATRPQSPPASPRRSWPAWLAGSPESAAHPQGGSVEQHSTPTPVVNAFNEWDPLEEIIVGVVDETRWCRRGTSSCRRSSTTRRSGSSSSSTAARRWPVEMLKKAERDLDAFIDVLEAAGVTVRQPERLRLRAAARHARLGGREQLLRADAARRAARHRRPDHRGADGLAQPLDRAPRVPRALQGVLPRRRPLGLRAAAAPLGRELHAGVRGPGGGRTPALPAHRVRADVRRGRRHQVRPRRLHRPLELLQPLRHRVAAAPPRRRVHACTRSRSTTRTRCTSTRPSSRSLRASCSSTPSACVKVPDMFEKAGWDVLVCPEPEMPRVAPDVQLQPLDHDERA